MTAFHCEFPYIPIHGIGSDRKITHQLLTQSQNYEDSEMMTSEMELISSRLAKMQCSYDIVNNDTATNNDNLLAVILITKYLKSDL